MAEKKRRPRIVIPREVLLVEIERHCAHTDCNARTRVGLTKAEARLYDGFECERCERWNEDGLTERDIPDWWEELTITGLATLRPARPAATADTTETNEAGGEGVVARLSEAWQRESRREGRSSSSSSSSAQDAPDGSSRGSGGRGDEPV